MTVRSAVSITALVLFGSAVSPSAGASEGSPVFGEILEVRVVNLEVVVTDSEGNRVHGLRPEDFRLRVGGSVTPIAY